MWWWLVAYILRLWNWFRPPRPHGWRKPVYPEEAHHGWNKKKPPEVKAIIIHIKAMGPEMSYREVAACYNRGKLYRGITVGKTWVGDVIRESAYEIQMARKKIRARRLKLGPSNVTWAMDLTGKVDAAGRLHWLAGLVDHGSRANLNLTVLESKTSAALLRLLLGSIDLYGKPKFLRTDNEQIFASGLFTLGLRLLGIKHQRIDAGCPWQNGRIERFFGTLKRKLDHWSVANQRQLEASLRLFRAWYNHVRPHQHLQGMTPAEAWAGIAIQDRPAKEMIWFDAWDGLLTGYYIRR